MLITLVDRNRFTRTVEAPSDTHDIFSIVCADQRDENFHPDDRLFNASAKHYYKKTFLRVNRRSSIFEEV